MMLLLASLVAVIIAPFVIGGLRRIPGGIGRGFFDGFVVVSIGGLVLLHILPHAVAEGGARALGGAFLGVLLPLLTEASLDRGVGRRGRNLTLLAGLLGLALHALFDGVALTAGGHDQAHAHDQLLALAVVLHRLPVGIAIWWVVTPVFGRKVGVIALAVILGATVLGFFGAEVVHPALKGAGWAAFQAFVAGALLHVVVGHHEPREPSGSKDKLASVAGGVAAAVGLWALSTTHPMYRVAGALDAATTLLTLGLQCAAPLLLGLLLVGGLRILLPRGPVGGGTSWAQALRGALLGPLLCPCSCAVKPVYRGLVAGGAGAPAAVAFLVASPEVGVATVLLSLRFLGVELGLVHALSAGLVAVGVGTFIGAREQATQRPVPVPEPQHRVLDGLRHAFGEIADHTLPWVLFGLGIAALAEPLLAPARLTSIPASVQVTVAVALGMPLHLCAAGAMPLVAVLVHKGLTPGAAVAFLIAGPASLVGTNVLGRGARVVVGLAVTGGAVIAGYLVDLFLVAGTFPLHETASSGQGWLTWLCFFALALLSLLSLLRQGVPGFLGKVLSLDGRDPRERRPT
jgi:uncharacterized membrane protein YraQ (UPF0718 family)